MSIVGQELVFRLNYVRHLVCSEITHVLVIFAIVAAAILADKVQIDKKGLEQEKYMVILIVMAVIWSSACVAFAAVAVACRSKDDLSC